mmetsp:Transcript_4065/g.10028  ORF Transcript_4065/g.10028 Transcript_4065/m.10028 type:complete len:396 (+) Transcript_4065:1076-2263(+)
MLTGEAAATRAHRGAALALVEVAGVIAADRVALGMRQAQGAAAAAGQRVIAGGRALLALALALGGGGAEGGAAILGGEQTRLETPLAFLGVLQAPLQLGRVGAQLVQLEHAVGEQTFGAAAGSLLQLELLARRRQLAGEFARGRTHQIHVVAVHRATPRVRRCAVQLEEGTRRVRLAAPAATAATRLASVRGRGGVVQTTVAAQLAAAVTLQLLSLLLDGGRELHPTGGGVRLQPLHDLRKGGTVARILRPAVGDEAAVLGVHALAGQRGSAPGQHRLGDLPVEVGLLHKVLLGDHLPEDHPEAVHVRLGVVGGPADALGRQPDRIVHSSRARHLLTQQHARQTKVAHLGHHQRGRVHHRLGRLLLRLLLWRDRCAGLVAVVRSTDVLLRGGRDI